MPRYFREGVASAAIKAVSRRRTTDTVFAATLFNDANAEPFQYNLVITSPAEPKPPFHGLDQAAPRRSKVNAW